MTKLVYSYPKKDKQKIDNKLTDSKIIKSNDILEIDFYNANKDLPNEKWEELIFTDNFYEISNYGRIKSYVINTNGAILRKRLASGYMTVTLRVSKEEKNYFIHKLVAEHFVLKDDKNQNVVIHIDNDKQNNYYKNLKWVNHKERFAHTDKFNNQIHEKFRMNKTSAAKITQQDADKIREMIANGITQNIIAKLFGVSEMQITRIKKNENWVTKMNENIETKIEKNFASLAFL